MIYNIGREKKERKKLSGSVPVLSLKSLTKSLTSWTHATRTKKKPQKNSLNNETEKKMYI